MRSRIAGGSPILVLSPRRCQRRAGFVRLLHLAISENENIIAGSSRRVGPRSPRERAENGSLLTRKSRELLSSCISFKNSTLAAYRVRDYVYKLLYIIIIFTNRLLPYNRIDSLFFFLIWLHLSRNISKQRLIRISNELRKVRSLCGADGKSYPPRSIIFPSGAQHRCAICIIHIAARLNNAHPPDQDTGLTFDPPNENRSGERVGINYSASAICTAENQTD